MSGARLVLADGTAFEGRGFGSEREAIGEAVFNTAMFGYQETLTDPSYVGQIVAFSTAQLGNVGTNPDDEESATPKVAGMVVRALSQPSNWRAREPLDAYLARHHIAGIEGIDTRKLVRHLRTHGAQAAVLSRSEDPLEVLAARARAAPAMEGLDLATTASTTKTYAWSEGTRPLFSAPAPRAANGPKVVAVDYGLKRAMLRDLVDAGAQLVVVPANTSGEEILEHRPKGVFLTNGPGDPAALPKAIAAVQHVLGKVPVAGICLGHQLLALALGGQTYKMKFGHHGANQPVLEVATGRVEITSHNHGFAVDRDSLKGRAQVTHHNLNDNTVEGLAAFDLGAFSVQYHPEASPGPHDGKTLFQTFVRSLS